MLLVLLLSSQVKCNPVCPLCHTSPDRTLGKIAHKHLFLSIGLFFCSISLLLGSQDTVYWPSSSPLTNPSYIQCSQEDPPVPLKHNVISPLVIHPLPRVVFPAIPQSALLTPCPPEFFFTFSLHSFLDESQTSICQNLRGKHTCILKSYTWFSGLGGKMSLLTQLYPVFHSIVALSSSSLLKCSWNAVGLWDWDYRLYPRLTGAPLS